MSNDRVPQERGATRSVAFFFLYPNLKLADHTLSSRHDQLPTLHPLQGGRRTGDHPGHAA